MVEKLGDMRGVSVKRNGPVGLGQADSLTVLSAQHAVCRGLHCVGACFGVNERHAHVSATVMPLERWSRASLWAEWSYLVRSPTSNLPVMISRARSELDGANRMGASFGGMLASGQKVRSSRVDDILFTRRSDD